MFVLTSSQIFRQNFWIFACRRATWLQRRRWFETWCILLLPIRKRPRSSGSIRARLNLGSSRWNVDRTNKTVRIVHIFCVSSWYGRFWSRALRWFYKKL